MISVEFINGLSPERRRAVMARSMADFDETLIQVRAILARIRANPDQELKREYGEHLEPADFKVTPQEIAEAYQQVPAQVVTALKEAAANISKFHKSQLERPMWLTEVADGILAGRTVQALDTVGVYIPGGRASYPSSALMNMAPARAAGVRRLIAATPPDESFKARPEILVAADIAGADAIYKWGGPWAVGALAFGLAGAPRVHKIVGPGSRWVTAAKMAVFGQVDIDMPAGPSEGFIIADHTARADHLAWDLIAQLEHDPDAAAVLTVTCESLAREVARLVNEALPRLSRREIVEQSLGRAGAILVAGSLGEAVELANEYAPEHLQIITEEPWGLLTKIKNAGSIFLGAQAPIPCGDYATGPNHVLPTGGAAWMFSGLSVDSFLKKITFQYLTREGLKNLAPTVITLAEAEGLTAHAQSVRVRLAGPGGNA